MGTTVVALREIQRAKVPGQPAKEKGQRGTPPVIQKIAKGTRFVVDSDDELKFLMDTKSVTIPETPAQVAEARGNLKDVGVAEEGDSSNGKAKQRGEIVATVDKPVKATSSTKGRGKGKASKSASDLI
jgi:hypothetical protein